MNYSTVFMAVMWVGLTVKMGGTMSTGFIDTPIAQVDEVVQAETARETSPFTENEEEELVELHNYVRRTVNPPASNMEYISWDPYLQDLAQRWADECLWRHGTPDNVEGYYGQNLWAITEHGSPSPKAIVGPWAEELNFYNYTTNSCMPGKVCGHYTQIIWGTTNRIGCGRTFCPILKGSGKNKWIVVCQYAPAGNVIDRHPYTSGPPCTQCSSGVGQCYEDLCRPCGDHDEECECRQVCYNCGAVDDYTCTCRCPQGYRGSDCSEICQDLHSSCGNNPGFPDARFCHLHPVIPYICPLMCGVCSAPLEDATCDETKSVAMTEVDTTPVTDGNSSGDVPESSNSDLIDNTGGYNSGEIEHY